MEWRIAEGLLKLRKQINEMFPNRSKDSDGSIGDAAHATRSSDHNPWVHDSKGQPIVTAIDITHDPKNGFDSYAFAEFLMTKKDPRIKYVISNRRIGAGMDGPAPWSFRKYTGSNPHDHHIHISIKADQEHFDNAADWSLAGFKSNPENVNTYEAPMKTIKRGSMEAEVAVLQTKLHIPVTGSFDTNTYYAVLGFQVGKMLVPDGIVGPQTWKALG